MNDELVIGRVRKPHGVHGELKVESLSGEYSHFKRLIALTLVRGDERCSIAIRRVRIAHGVALVSLQGVDSPEEAKRWSGWDVVASRANAAPLGQGEYYYADLVGLSVIVKGSPMGVVANVLDGGPWPLLEVSIEDGTTRIVPFTDHFVGELDLRASTLELLDPEVLE